MDARNRQTLGVVFVAALVAFLIALIPTCGQAAEPTAAVENECAVEGDVAKYIAEARDQGVDMSTLLASAKMVGQRNGVGTGALTRTLVILVYTNDELARMTPRQVLRSIYQACMRIQ